MSSGSGERRFHSSSASQREPGAGSRERRPASAPRPWERRGCGAADHWRRTPPPPPPRWVQETAAPRRRRPRLGSPAGPRARPPGPSPASRRCQRTIGCTAARLPGRCPSCGGDTRSRTTVPAPRPGGIVRGRRAEDPQGRAAGQPGFGPPRHRSLPGVPLAGEREVAVTIPPRGRGGRGLLGHGPRSPPSPPPRGGEFRAPGSPARMLPAPRLLGWKLGQGQGLM